MRKLALLCLATGCTTRSIAVGDLHEITMFKAIPNRDLDVLFVVDNSPSMLDEQMQLAGNFPRIIDALSALDGGMPNLHIGVVTSDMGTTGSLDPSNPAPRVGASTGACDGQGDNGALQHANAPELTESFIRDVELDDGTRRRNYTGELREVFAHIALVGDRGCGFEQHLRAMERGLTDPSGFVRPEANLAVVIVADEDDCSVATPAFFGVGSDLGPLQSFRCFAKGVTCDPSNPDTPGAHSHCVPFAASPYVDDVAPFVDELVALKGDARRVMVAGIIGDPAPVVVERAVPPGETTAIPQLAPSCVYDGPSGTQHADPAVRLAAFLDRFPGRSQRTSICNPDLSGALSQVGETAKQLVGSSCIDIAYLADSSADPGLQPACQVTDVRDAAPGEPLSIPACGEGIATDCFNFVEDPRTCPTTPDHLRLQIARSHQASDDTWTHVRCQVTP
jgi:hypothetical protein